MPLQAADLLRSVCRTQLFIRVEQFDTVDRTIRRNINVQFVADVDRLHVFPYRLQSKVGDILVPIVSQFHWQTWSFNEAASPEDRRENGDFFYFP
jgi:hypothetical protein